MLPLHDVYEMQYPSIRQVTYAGRGMVCASQHLAAQAGLSMLRAGGNAVDAAVAAAAALTVVEPCSNGIGGDAFALVWMRGQLYGLNASGPAPALMDAQSIRRQGHTQMPALGWLPVTVPGAPAAWAALSGRFGKLPFAALFEPAVGYAAQGYPVSPVTARVWADCEEQLRSSLSKTHFARWAEVFAPKGAAPRPGEVWASEAHAETLRDIAATKSESFYLGALSERIDAYAKEDGGYIRKEDLAAYRPEWVTPIRTRYRGYDVWEIPPNGHGIVALMALNILGGYDFAQRDTVETLHLQWEAMKLAFADGRHHIADPHDMRVTAEQLLSDGYAARRRALIGAQALAPAPGEPDGSDTVYFCAADGEGNMVSMIQSNYQQFGSGLVVPGTGIALHDRGANFSLDLASPNCIAPRKKPYHTIIPGFLTHQGQAVGPFGVMGGFMQPQGHVQVIMNSLDFHLNPQQALDAWRWQWVGGRRMLVEPAFPQALAEGLRARGHEVLYAPDYLTFGRGQIIWRDECGVLCGGTEPRADGACAAW